MAAFDAALATLLRPSPKPGDGSREREVLVRLLINARNMNNHAKRAGAVLLTALVLAGCPTRRNPSLPDAEIDEDADVDTGADADLDAETAVDADRDADVDLGTDGDVDGGDGDGACNQPGQVICDGECVWVNTKARCGDCETQCESFTSCRCEQYGDTYRCWSNSEAATCVAE